MFHQNPLGPSGSGSSQGRRKSAGLGKPPPIPDAPKRKSLPVCTEKYKDGAMYSLVVCGTDTIREHNDVDATIFGDFIGIAGILQYIGAGCDAISCFPIEEYFQETQYRDIKFGEQLDNKGPVITFSYSKWKTRQQNFFSQVTAEEMRDRIILWIQEVGGKARMGDVVNIFFQCHGDMSGAIMVGKNGLESETVARLVDESIGGGIQVNLVGSHCYSGKLVDAVKARGTMKRLAVSACGPAEFAWSAHRSVSNRLRNMRFAEPFIQSLAKCKLPQIEQTEAPGPLTAEGLHDFLKDALRNVTPISRSQGVKPQNPQMHSSQEQQHALSLFEDLILREMVDVIHKPSDTHRRRRLEWPTLVLPAIQRMQTDAGPIGKSPAAISMLKGVVHRAFSACYDPERPFAIDINDNGMIGAMKKARPDYGLLINNLYWRARQQSCIWDLYLVLVERGFLSYNSLAVLIDYQAVNDNAYKVYQWLTCFEFPSQVLVLQPRPFKGYEGSELPVFWLAIMIARECSERPDKMLELINWSGMLGKLDYDKVETRKQLRTYSDHTLIWTCNLQNHGPGSDYPPVTDFFGSWLPHGLGPNVGTYADQMVDKFFVRFEQIEKAFKAFYDIPDEQLVEEAHQAEFLRLHPNWEPRLKHSGHWISPALPVGLPRAGGPADYPSPAPTMSFHGRGESSRRPRSRTGP